MAKELDGQQMDVNRIRGELKLSPHYPMDKLLRQANNYSWERLINVYHKLLETDISIKIGKQKDRLALDVLVAELCS